MSVHQLKDARWFCQYRKGKKIKREYFGRGVIAEREARERDTQLALAKRFARQPIEKSPSFKTLAEGYLSARIASIEKSTYDVLNYKLKAFLLPELGDIESMKITKERIDRYVLRRLSQGKQTSTIHREITDIQAILNWAVNRKLISHNPLSGYKKPRPNPLIVAPPTLIEIQAINKQAAGHLQRALKIIFYTGARPGQEILSLKWESVNWSHNTIRIISAKKHGLKFRDVPISKPFLAELEGWYAKDKKQKGMNIVNYNGKGIKSIQTSWGHALQKAEIQRPIRPYSYRHAFTTMLIDAGADIKSVSELIGHATTALTLQTYKHTSMASHRAAIDKIPVIIW